MYDTQLRPNTRFYLRWIIFLFTQQILIVNRNGERRVQTKQYHTITLFGVFCAVMGFHTGGFPGSEVSCSWLHKCRKGGVTGGVLNSGVVFGVGGSSSELYGAQLDVSGGLLQAVVFLFSASFCSSFCFCCCSLARCSCFCWSSCSCCSAEAMAVDRDARAAPAADTEGIASPKLMVPDRPVLIEATAGPLLPVERIIVYQR